MANDTDYDGIVTRAKVEQDCNLQLNDGHAPHCQICGTVENYGHFLVESWKLRTASKNGFPTTCLPIA